jgi:CDP-diacylglycerol--glycerol-3-phosphate 3-phosphatidyltransferase
VLLQEVPVAASRASADAVAERLRRAWVPNAVTFLRAGLVPVILVLLAAGDEFTGARWLAFAVFVFAALTDTLDGWVARRLEGVTAFGAFADPLADKILVVGVLASLALFGELPWWLVGIVFGRELVVTLLRLVLVRRAGVVVAATLWGKLKTVTQMVAAGAVILPIVGGWIVDALLVLTVVMTVGSGLDYLWRSRTLVGRARLDGRMGTREVRA